MKKCKRWRYGISKTHVLKWYKWSTIEYQLLMHRFSCRKHYILGFPIFSGRQTVEKRAWPIKKSPKSQKLKFLRWLRSERVAKLLIGVIKLTVHV